MPLDKAAWIVIGLTAATATVAVVHSHEANRRNRNYYRRLNEILDMSSPTYSYGPPMTQTNNCLPIPLVYGEVKVAGNTIWQSDENTSAVKRLVALGDGEIDSILDVRINEKDITELEGCSYSAYIGNGTQSIDDRVPGETQEEKVDVSGGLKYTAYVAITAKTSSQVGSDFNLTAKVKGKKVKVYSDTQNYSISYSNNPAWCLLDFLTAYNGCGLSTDEIDIQSFIDSASYCDEVVNDNPRFTLNLILDEKKSRIDWIENILLSCRGYIIYQGGKISMRIEQAESTMQVFDEDNILDGTENFWTTPREEKVDIFKVQYIDPENEYARIYATAEADVFENEQPIVQEARIYGVTNFHQASRLAWYYLNQAKTCHKFISFITSQEGLDRTVGDVIEVTSTFLGYTNKKMRIMQMAEAQTGQIEIVCKEYNENLYNDTLGSVEPIINSVSLPSVFDTPPTPTNLTLSEVGWMTTEGNHIATIEVEFDEVDYQHFSHYEISYSDDNGITWKQGEVSYDGKHTIQNIKVNQEYLVAVETITHRGVKSLKAQESITTTGKDNLPASVSNFTIVQKGDYLKAFIVPNNESDIKYYEIRQGASWDKAELVQQFSGRSVIFKPTKEGSVTYSIKAVDNFGNYSEDPTLAAINVQGLTPKNILIERNEDMNNWANDSKSYLDMDGKYKLAIDSSTSQLYSQSEIVLPIIDLGINFQDFRKPKETDLSVNVDFNETDNTQVEIMYRTAYYDFLGWDYLEYDTDNWEDNATKIWSDWKILQNEPEFCGQFVEIKLVAKSLDDITNVDIESVNVKADIEDVEDIVKNISIPAQKTRVDLNKTFTVPPTITLNTMNLTGKASPWRMTSITNNSFDIELLDDSDNLIEGTLLQATARGY